MTLTSARRQAVPYTIVASGIVTPSQTAAVAPQVDGIITQVAFHEGQDVEQGQPLFRIEPQQYQAAYQQAVAVLARDKATAENARLEAERYILMAQNNVGTAEQAQQQRAVSDAAVAQVMADSAMVSTARFNLDKTIIRAPIGGRTGSLLVHEGNLVHAAGASALVTITQLHPILVRFAIPASQLPLIQQYSSKGGLHVLASHGPAQSDSSIDSTRGTPAENAPAAPSMGGGRRGQTTGPARGGRPGAADDPPPSRADSTVPTGAPVIPPEPGTLSFIDNAVDTTTGTVMLKATFNNPMRTLWPGQFVSIQLNLFTEQQALVLPTQAVQSGQQGSYVYVVDSANTAQQRKVTVERTAGSLTVIQSGLRDGEKVVAEGQSRLTPGATVTLAGDSAAAGRGAGGRRRGGAAAR
ncbi:MAG TPA: efflux RND transporter periplasmic adaptor subunit [Gemmatimonadales bacterium]